MTAKQYLSRYRKHMADILFYEALKDDAINNISSLKSPSFEERVSVSPQNDPIGNLVIEYERNVGKYNLEIINCKAKMILIENQICKLREVNEDYYRILAYKYKLGLGWDEIASKMYLSRSAVTHMHSPALRKFDELFSDSYKDF
ncbi:MAG: hypothetical protein J6S67_19260 [Methanobrevibacter sp.]|nr:hypothetical protein [Methanobrevibacter sp.]